MEQEIFRLATSQGIWAVLFVALLFYVLKENAHREERLLECLEKLSNDYGSLARDVQEIRENVKELKEKLE